MATTASDLRRFERVRKWYEMAAREAAAASDPELNQLHGSRPEARTGLGVRGEDSRVAPSKIKRQLRQPIPKKRSDPPEASPRPRVDVSAGAVFYALVDREHQERVGRGTDSFREAWQSVARTHPNLREAFAAEERAGVAWRRWLDCRAESKLDAAQLCADYLINGVSLDEARFRTGQVCPSIRYQHRGAVSPPKTR